MTEAELLHLRWEQPDLLLSFAHRFMCSAPGCQRRATTKGHCNRCRIRFLRYGGAFKRESYHSARWTASRAAMNEVLDDAWASTLQLIAWSGLNKMTVRNHLQAMLADGLVERKKQGKLYLWRLPPGD